MKKTIFFVITLLLAFIAHAEVLTPALPGKRLGIKENNHLISKTFTDPSGNSEIFTVFKAVDSKVTWTLENKTPNEEVSSRIQKFKDGSELIENFSSNGKVISKIHTDKNGKTTIRNF